MAAKAYPIIIKKEEECYLVYVPGFDIDTYGKDIPDCIYMAKDAIGLMGIQLQDEGKELPKEETVIPKKDEILAYVDIDFDMYRMKHDTRKVKKNCTISFRLNYEAEKRGINFSRVLEEALIRKLGLENA